MFENISLRIKCYSLDKQIIAIFYNKQIHIEPNTQLCFEKCMGNAVLQHLEGSNWWVIPDGFQNFAEHSLYLMQTLLLSSAPHYLCHLKSNKDTFINVVPKADISKRHKITFFSIISKISIFTSQNFVKIYLGVVPNRQVQKIGAFQVKWQGKIKK